MSSKRSIASIARMSVGVKQEFSHWSSDRAMRSRSQIPVSTQHWSSVSIKSSASSKCRRPVMSAKEGHRFRASTWHSLQTLTRALRESLRVRRLRKQRRLKDEDNDSQMRQRSKSLGHACNPEEEISEVSQQKIEVFYAKK